jgi:hypothetical protein
MTEEKIQQFLTWLLECEAKEVPAQDGKIARCNYQVLPHPTVLSR